MARKKPAEQRKDPVLSDFDMLASRAALLRDERGGRAPLATPANCCLECGARVSSPAEFCSYWCRYRWKVMGRGA